MDEEWTEEDYNENSEYNSKAGAIGQRLKQDNRME